MVRRCSCPRARSERSVIERQPRPDRDHAGLHELADAERLEHAQQGVELVGVAGGLDGHRVGGDVDDLGPEQLDGLEHVRAGLQVGPDLDQHQLALDRRRRLELDDLEHVDQLVELLGDLLERELLDVDHDGHARDRRSARSDRRRASRC